MVDSIRERIVDDIASALEGITIAGGYDFNVGPVLRKRKPQVQISEYPTILLAESTEEVEIGPIGQGSFGTFTRRLTVELVVFVHQHDDTAQEVNKALANVEKAVMVDPFRAGLAVDTNLASNEVFVDDESEPRGGVTVRVEVLYRTDRKDPFSTGT